MHAQIQLAFLQLNWNTKLPDLAAGLQCVSPWLSNMVNPAIVADSLTSLQAELTVFSAARAAAASGLATYSTVRSSHTADG